MARPRTMRLVTRKRLLRAPLIVVQVQQKIRVQGFPAAVTSTRWRDAVPDDFLPEYATGALALEIVDLEERTQ